MSQVILQVSPEEFVKKTRSYLDVSPVVKEWQDVKLLKWPQAMVPPHLWSTLKEVLEVVAAVCAAVELTKSEFLKNVDVKVKIDKTLALKTAAEIIFSFIKFGGVTGPFINVFWKLILNLIISTYVSQYPSNWLATAMLILKVVA